jgi:aldehyde:ferredoxin oxidoreductase
LQPLKGGPTDGISLSQIEVEQAKDWYFEILGWDQKNGNPDRKCLEGLDLGWVADILEI